MPPCKRMCRTPTGRCNALLGLALSTLPRLGAVPAIGISLSHCNGLDCADDLGLARLRWPRRRMGDGMTALSVNGKSYEVDVEPDTPLLWVLRDTIGLTGTKYGCGIAPVWRLHRAYRRQVATLLPRRGRQSERAPGDHDRGAGAGGSLHPVQQAWIESRRATMRLLSERHDDGRGGPAQEKPNPTDADIDAAITNICRCGTYQRVRAAIHAAAGA